MSQARPGTKAQETFEARNPATGAVLGSVTLTPPERIDEVVAAVGQVQPLWALLRVEDRARYMRRMAQAIIDDFDELEGVLSPRAGPAARGDRDARAAARRSTR